MEALSVIAGLALGLAAGAGATVLALRRARALAVDAALAAAGADAKASLAVAQARLAARDDEVRELAARVRTGADEARAAQAAVADERVARAGVEAALHDERERSAERLATLRDARDELTAHFKALAGDALEANRKRIAEQQHGALDQILRPLGEKLAAFEKKVEDTYDKEAQSRSSLRQEVLNLQAATLRINEDARNLTRALKGDAKMRGDWGEVVLERVLERSGLVRGQEYVVQHVLRDDDGRLSRPDVVIRLPDDKHIVIDSKVSLVAYDRYHAAEDDAARRLHGEQHVAGMREHAKALAAKSYQHGKGLDSPDFVAMFVPIEPALGLASSLDEDLFLDTWGRGIVMVTPSTLLAFLMTVQSLWQRDRQTRNAIAIAEESGKLHDQFVAVMKSLDELGRRLGDAQRAFEQTKSRFSDGRGNLVGRVRKLQAMGAKTKKQLPPDLVAQRDGDDADEGDDDGRDGAAPAAQSKLTLVPPAGDA